MTKQSWAKIFASLAGIGGFLMQSGVHIGHLGSGDFLGLLTGLFTYGAIHLASSTSAANPNGSSLATPSGN